MDTTWMGPAMAVHAILAVILVAAIVYLCLAAASYLRAKTAESRRPPSVPEA